MMTKPKSADYKNGYGKPSKNRRRSKSNIPSPDLWSALKLKDFKDAIWSHSGCSAEVVGIVGFCIILTQDEQQLPKSLEKKYRRYVLVMTNQHQIAEVSWETLQKSYDGNVIRWATERQRRFHDKTQEQIKILNIRLRELRAKIKAAKPGVEDMERLTELYLRQPYTVFGRTKMV